MTPQNSSNDTGLGCVNYLILGICVFFIYTTWPFSLLLIAGIVGIIFTNKSNNIIMKALNRILKPVTWGLTIFAMVFFVIDLFNIYDPAILNNYEGSIIDLRLKTKKWLNISFLKLTIILLLLLVITFVIPQYRPITKFSKTYRYLQYFTITLATLTSFTFFAQKPTDNLVNIEHKIRVEKYKVMLRKGEEEVGKYISARIIEDEIRNLSQLDKKRLKASFDSIQNIHKKYNNSSIGQGISLSKYSYSDIRGDVLEKMIKDNIKWSRKIKRKAENEISGEMKIFTEITSMADKLNQLKVITEREAFNSKSKTIANEAIKALEVTFIHSLGINGTDIQQVGELFTKKIFHLYANRMLNTHIIEQFNVEKKIEVGAEKLREFKFFETSSSKGGIISSFNAGTGSSGNSPFLPISGHFSSIIAERKNAFEMRMNYEKQMKERFRTGFGKNRSVRSYGG